MRLGVVHIQPIVDVTSIDYQRGFAIGIRVSGVKSWCIVGVCAVETGLKLVK